MLIVLLPLRSFFIKKQKVSFLHIPKNAGTYIEKVGKENGYEWGIYNKTTQKEKSNINCTHWHVPPKYMKGVGKDYYKNSSTFCVLRNPYERIISEFKYINRGNKENVTKENLNKYIHKLPEIIKKNKFSQDCHLLPQYEYIYDDYGNRICDHILDFDNLGRDINALNSYYKLGLTKIDHSKKNTTSFSKLNKNDLDEKSLQIIKQLYKKDFELGV